jgi:endogenous inhibitor of DNA gyrase (YacG/DUF329 family)
MPANGKPVIVKCPTCKRPIPWTPEQKYKPFCCERCKLIDLGEWVMEEKRIPGEPQDPEWNDDGNSSLH